VGSNPTLSAKALFHAVSKGINSLAFRRKTAESLFQAVPVGFSPARRKSGHRWGHEAGAPDLLTDTACRQARPSDRDRKLADSGSLYLLIKPTGTKSWRWKFRFGGKEKQLVIGHYPAISLADARRARDAARIQLSQGIDPCAVKQQAKAAAGIERYDSFESVARAWHVVKATTLSPKYAKQILERLKGDAFPQFGKLPIGEVTPPIVLAAIRKIEARGATVTAQRVRIHLSEIFVWAIASGLTDSDPAAIIRKALAPRTKRLRPAFNRIEDARALLTASEALPSTWTSTRLASQLLAVVKAAIAANPKGPWLFPGSRTWRKPISDSTLSKHYRDLGYTDLHVPHGWRATFSTIMNELAAVEDRERDREIIDLMLAHIKDGVEAAYNRAAYLPRRRELAQTWADMIMPPGAQLQGVRHDCDPAQGGGHVAQELRRR